jgi:hypothetical protein
LAVNFVFQDVAFSGLNVNVPRTGFWFRIRVIEPFIVAFVFLSVTSQVNSYISPVSFSPEK